MIKFFLVCTIVKFSTETKKDKINHVGTQVFDFEPGDELLVTSLLVFFGLITF